MISSSIRSVHFSNRRTSISESSPSQIIINANKFFIAENKKMFQKNINQTVSDNKRVPRQFPTTSTGHKSNQLNKIYKKHKLSINNNYHKNTRYNNNNNNNNKFYKKTTHRPRNYNSFKAIIPVVLQTVKSSTSTPVNNNSIKISLDSDNIYVAPSAPLLTNQKLMNLHQSSPLINNNNFIPKFSSLSINETPSFDPFGSNFGSNFDVSQLRSQLAF